ncbi:putative ribonuclease H-like domain-containing protein [Tanacetum coccineum]
MWRLRIEQYFQVQDYALWNVIKTGNSFKPVPQTTTNADGSSTSLIPGPVTTEEKAQKKNDVKTRSMLLMALPNEHLMTFNQYKDAKTLFAAIQTRFSGNEATKKTQKTLLKQMYKEFSAPSTESLDFIFNRLQKIIIEQEVKGTASSSSSSSSQNMAFVSSPSSTNEVNIAHGVSTTNTQVSPSSTQVNITSTQVNTANLSDDTVYAFFANQPNGSQLVYEDLEQIHEDDIEEMDLKWQLALLSMRTRRGPRNQDSRNRNQDSSRRTINVEETSSKAMVAIDGAGFDWSYMADDEVPTNMALMTFSDFEFNKSEFNLATYKRGLASLKEQLVFYKKNKLEKIKQEKESNQLKIENFKNASKSLDKLIRSQITDKSRKGVGFVNYNVVPPPLTRLFSPPKFDLSNSGLEEFQQPEFEGYRPKTSKSVSEDISNEVRESLDAPLVKELVLDDKLEKKTIFPTVAKIEFVRPKQQEKPVRKPVKYAKMYRSQSPRGNQRNWNNQKSQQLGSDFVMYNKACFVCGSFDHVQADCNYHQRERVVSRNNYTRVNYNYSAKKTHPSAHRNMVPRAVLMKTGLRSLNTARPVNTAHPKTIVYSARPMSHFSKSAQSTIKRPYQIRTSLTNKNSSQKVNIAKGKFYTARPNSAVVNVVRANQGHPQKEDQGYVDSGCSRHMTGNMSYLSNFKEFDGGYALTVNPTIYTSCIKQFWATAKAKTVNGEVQIQALVDGKNVIVTETSVRRDLQLKDAEGTECLPNATIFEQLTLMGAKTTTWNEFSSTMDSAIICLATNQKFNFSKYIFDNMVKNLEGGVKFLMYPRFVQVFLDKQVKGMTKHKEIYVIPSHTKKVFANMKRGGKGFFGRVTPLFQTMMVQAPKELGEGSEIPTDPQHTPTIIQPSTSQPQKIQPRRKQRKDTEVPQPSGSTEPINDEAANEKHVPIHSNDPLLSGEDRLKLNEFMELYTNLSQRVLDLENTKTSQAAEITKLKERWDIIGLQHKLRIKASSGNTNSTESLYPNFQKAKGFHAVPPPTGTIIPPRANVSFTGIDELAIRNKVLNQENTKSSQPEIDRNKVIIEDWVDSDDEETVLNSSETQKKTVFNSENSETSFENRSPSSQNSVGQESRKTGFGNKGGKLCFVCYSPNHLIKDCNLHERTFKQTQTHKPKGTQGSRDTRPVWNNINRVNHSNFSGNSRYPHQKKSFIPSAVLTREGLKSTARPKMTQTVPSKSTANVFYQGTARPRVPHAVLSQSTGRPYYPRMDNIRPRTSSFSPSTRSSTTRTPHRPQRPKKIMKSIWVKKESTVGSQAVLPQNVSVKRSAMIKPTQTWRPKGAYLDSVNRDNGSYTLKQFEYGNPEEDLKDYAIIDSGCSGSMTGDKDKLSDFKEFKGGYVAFGNDPKGGRITGKGTIKTSCIDFEKVSYVEELKFNLLSVSQICDKKHNVLFTDKECLILSPKFKFVDEDLVILRAPRKNDVYSLDLKNIIPSGGVTCLVAKATKDEAVLWHRRLGHVNFKNINKLVKGNLVRGLPSKTFKLDHSCLACRKGKQHRASCKKIEERTVREPLELLHMDLFGPVSVESINKKKYCLVVTDDCSKFSWVFFLAYKDETYDMLHDLIVGLENRLRHKVKTIRCDNGTEFKNQLMNEFCAKKGIKREYSIARTPQQNGVAERKNRTLIEAARTMLADSLLPIQFWAEAVNTACYVLNRVLVTKPQMKTPYEILMGRSPNISFMRPFGCSLTILNTLDQLGKFDGKSEEGYLLGYSTNSKGFRVYNRVTRKVQECLHVDFLENQENQKGKGPDWMFDLDLLTPSMNYIPVRKENYADSKEQGISCDDVEDLDDQQFIVHTAQPMHTEERTAAKEVPLSSAEQALHDELVSLMHQESLAKAHNDDQRIAFEEEKKRIALDKGKECVDSTFTLSTANTPPQSTGNTPTDSDDDIPKDGIFSTNSFDAEEGGVADYNNMDSTIDVPSTY